MITSLTSINYHLHLSGILDLQVILKAATLNYSRIKSLSDQGKQIILQEVITE